MELMKKFYNIKSTYLTFDYSHFQMESPRDNQTRLFEGLGIPWAEMQQEPPEELSEGIPETVVITNYSKDPVYLHVIYDCEQILIAPMGRNLLCLCDSYLRRMLRRREGELTEGGTIGFELIQPFWDRQKNFDLMELTGNQSGNRHILLVDKCSLPTLQEMVIATLSEETLDKLRQTEYGILVKDHRTHIMNFVFHIHDMTVPYYDHDPQVQYGKFYWENDSGIFDICPSCSCERCRGPRRDWWDWH